MASKPRTTAAVAKAARPKPASKPAGAKAKPPASRSPQSPLHAAGKAEERPPRFSGRSDRFGTIPFDFRPASSPHGQVTAVSMMKDEGPYVVEWVAHHLALGFTDLVIYTNDCTDGTDDMLIRMEDLGLVHHRRNRIPPGQRPQPSALNHAQEEPVVQATDWLMVFDADEFLAIRHGDGTLGDLIDAIEASHANGMVITWRIFGSGGVVDWSRDPVTEQFLLAAPPMWNKGWGVKTLFKHDPRAWKLGIHRPKMKSKMIETDFPDQIRWLNGSGAVMEDYFKFRGWRSIARTVGYDWAQLNHYAVKSVEAYALRRLRGNVNNKADKYNAGYWALQDRNEVRDDTMLRYSARRAEVVAALLRDPVIAGLHAAALAGVDERLADLRRTQAYAELRATLEQASAVPITQITAAPPQPRDKVKIAAMMSDVERRRTDKAKVERKAEGVTAPPVATPIGVYVSHAVEADRDVPMEWFTNHSMQIPADPRVFTPVGLDLVKAGRLDRALARRLPTLLPADSAIVELGAGTGFLSGHLHKKLPKARILMIEDDAGLRATLARVMERNDVTLGASISLAPVGDLPSQTTRIADFGADVAILSDPRLQDVTPEDWLSGLTHLPGIVILCGRFLERAHAALDPFEQALSARGYVPVFGFDPTVARGFARDQASRPGTPQG